jgi:1,4-alpha-glucan branching enzyme
MRMTTHIKGYWMPVLHAHLPFVKHPEYDYFLEENWLFEAISESYIPLLVNMKKMADEGIEFKLTVSISPPLLEMFADEHLMGKYLKYLDKHIELSSKEIDRLQRDPKFRCLARFYKKRYREVKSFFTGFLDHNVLNGYRYFHNRGNLEILTSCATHGLLPLLRQNRRTVEAQVSIAVESHKKHLGSFPEGMWLPECAYYDGLETVLKQYAVNFFFLDTQGLLDGKPAPRYGVYAPVYTENGIAVFGRDPLSSKQVWSAQEGYPGDYHYRDFYRDAGFDLDFEYIRPYINPDGERVFTGIKYYRITGEGSEKKPYDPRKAFNKTGEHARHFYLERKKQVEELGVHMDRKPVVLSPYDAELFGHWWFEGPDFLYHVFHEIEQQKDLKAITPSEYLGRYPRNQVISPRPTSWGYNGFYDSWLNSENDWVYRHLHRMADTLENLANRHYHERDSIHTRLLNQLARELLLAQSSDWAFLITTRTAREYAEKRTKEHISNFHVLQKGLQSKNIDVPFLEQVEKKNSIFRELDFRVYASTGVRS